MFSVALAAMIAWCRRAISNVRGIKPLSGGTWDNIVNRRFGLGRLSRIICFLILLLRPGTYVLKQVRFFITGIYLSNLCQNFLPTKREVIIGLKVYHGSGPSAHHH